MIGVVGMDFRKLAAAAAMMAGALTLAAAGPAAASGSSAKIVMDEDGNGSTYFNGALVATFTGFMATDAGPGGLLSVLTYVPDGSIDFVAGDVLGFQGLALDDWMRFVPAGTGGPGLPAGVVFMSNPVDGIDSKADVNSPPFGMYPNFRLIQETSLGGGMLGYLYTPGPGDPGFVLGVPVTVTYEFISGDDVIPVPEPATWAMMLLGTGLIGASLRRRRAAV
jgi:hypothetical protein